MRNTTTALLIGMLVAGCRSMPEDTDRRLGWGVPADAIEWAKEFAELSDPSARSEQDTELRKFDDGTWIVGRASDSHSVPMGGTIVTRDSRGETRAFLGHVCGGTALRYLLDDADDLDSVYTTLLGTWKFMEYKWLDMIQTGPKKNP